MHLRHLAIGFLTFALLIVAGCDFTQDDSLQSPVIGDATEHEPTLAYEPSALTWQPVEGASSYEVRLARSFGSSHDTTVVVTREARLDTTFAVGSYDWQVRAVRDEERGPWSDTGRFVLDRFHFRDDARAFWNTSGIVPDTWYSVRGFVQVLSLGSELEALSLERSAVRAVRADSLWIELGAPSGRSLSDYSAFRVVLLDREDAGAGPQTIGELDPAPDLFRANVEVVAADVTAMFDVIDPSITVDVRTSDMTLVGGDYQATLVFLLTVEVEV